MRKGRFTEAQTDLDDRGTRGADAECEGVAQAPPEHRGVNDAS